MNIQLKTEAPYFAESYIGVIHQIMLVEAETIDAVYEDYILKLVGSYGLKALLDCGLIEPCGSVDGRRLYSIL